MMIYDDIDSVCNPKHPLISFLLTFFLILLKIVIYKNIAVLLCSVYEIKQQNCFFLDKLRR